MKLHRDIEQLPEFTNAVITIGSFDGVHKGHQKILEVVTSLAKHHEGESIVITFHPHPRQIVYPNDKEIRLINTIEEKAVLLEKAGINHLVIVNFTPEFSQQHPDEYIQRFILKKFNPSAVVIGFDHRFGHNRSGTVDVFRKYSEKEGFELIEIQKEEIDNLKISSSKIRTALSRGDVSSANEYLGNPFIIAGKVKHGAKVGSFLGFPTANILVPDKLKLIPPEGIYAAYVQYEGKRYKGMFYVGTRPTVSDLAEISLEVNIFDFNEELYGEEIVIELIKFLRYDAKFDTIDELRAQLQKDEKKSRLALAEYEASTVKMLDTAVVVMNFNGIKLLKKYLNALIINTPGARIIIADNASTDGSVQWVRKNFPFIDVILLHENFGFAGGYNRAFGRVSAKYFVLLNSDIRVTPGWLPPLVDALEEDDALAAVQPKILSDTQPDHFEYAGASGGHLDKYGYPFCRGRIFGDVEKDSGQYDIDEEIFWTSGAAMIVRADLYKKLGGLDEDYFAHMEEIDLCWRMKRAGYTMKCIPESTVYHLGGATLNYENPRKLYLNFRNNLYTLVKNEVNGRILWLILLKIILDDIAGIYFALKGKPDYLVQILKAHINFYGESFVLLKKRKRIKQLLKEFQVGKVKMTVRKKYSIVWQYFVLQKTKYSNIE